MGTSGRKQREVQQREQLFLETGRRLLIEQGFAGLSMDRLAEVTEYSKGTIYQHFSTKEDLVAALAVQSMERRLSLFDRATRFAGRARERLTALGVADELFARLHPHYYRSELIVKMADLENRASTNHLSTLNRLDTGCSRIVLGLIADAISAGDYVLTPPRTEGEIIFALVSLSIGAHSIILNHSSLLAEWKMDPDHPPLDRTVQTLLDGYGMKPLSSQWDYEATRTRILKEVFADESRIAGLD